jgi:O-antigen ligase
MSRNLLTPEHPNSQNIWSSLPWPMFLFLLAVFVLTTPLYIFDFYVRPEFAVDDVFGVVGVMHRDNWVRIVALIAFGTVSLFYFLRFKKDRFQINGFLGFLIIFYLAWVAFSIFWSIDSRFTIKRVGITLLLSLGAVYAADRISLQETKALVLFICSVSVFLGLFVLLRAHSFFPFESWWRFGGNQHPISQAWHCGLMFLSALALAKTAKQNRAVYIGLAIIAFLFLILTRSRMAFIACFMASAVYMGLVETDRYRGVIFSLGIIIGGCLIYFLLGSELSVFTDKVITLGRVGEVQSMSTLTGRIPLWKASLKLVNQRPFTGYGYEAFLTGKNLHWITKELGWATSSPHSGYMSALGGLGYIGFGTLVMILILAVNKSLRLAKRNPEYAYMVAVFVWLIFNLYTEDKVLARPYFPVFAWMIMLARLGFIREES